MAKQYKFTKSFTFDGKRYYVRGQTEAEVIKKMVLKQRDLEEGRVAVCGSMTLTQWSEICISTYKTRSAENTRESFTYVVKHYILEQIGSMQLKSIKAIHCQKVVNSCGHLSQYIINQVYIAMNFIFDRAVENSLILSNPARNITKPKGTKSTRRSLSQYEENVFLSACDTDSRFVLFLLMYHCGCRPSEAREAKGFDLKTVDGECLLHIRGTKTEKSDRYVPVPTALWSKIKDTPKFGAIAVNNAGNQFDDSSYSRAWSSLKREMNIQMGCRVYRNELVPPYPLAADIVPYCLRHTFCTNLQKNGVDIREAQYLMGHADIQMTANIYTHNDMETAVSVSRKMRSEKSSVASSVAPILKTV